MVDESRRRLLRLGALAAASLGGGVFLLVDRLRSGTSSKTVAATRPTSTTTASPTSTSPSGSTPDPASRSTTEGTAGTGAEAVTTAGPTSGASTPMLCREAWGAAAPTGALAAHQISGLMVHHTAVRLDDNRQAPSRIRGHQRFHQSRGFVDIAYHVFVDAHGNVFEGRDPDQPGETFTDYDPTGWFLVVCEGNFDEQPLPEAQLDAMARVLAWAADHYGVDPALVASHRQHAHTRCPGEAVHALVVDGTLAARVAEHRGSAVVEECGADATARVAAIEAGTDAQA